jgi:hypothetical protein
MVLRSLHRLSPLAQRFYTSKSRTEFLCCLLIPGIALPIAPSSFPGLPIFLPRCEVSQASVFELEKPIVAPLAASPII